MQSRPPAFADLERVSSVRLVSSRSPWVNLCIQLSLGPPRKGVFVWARWLSRRHVCVALPFRFLLNKASSCVRIERTFFSDVHSVRNLSLSSVYRQRSKRTTETYSHAPSHVAEQVAFDHVTCELFFLCCHLRHYSHYHHRHHHHHHHHHLHHHHHYHICLLKIVVVVCCFVVVFCRCCLLFVCECFVVVVVLVVLGLLFFLVCVCLFCFGFFPLSSQFLLDLHVYLV